MKKRFKTAIVGNGLIANAAHLPAIQLLKDQRGTGDCGKI